MSIWIVQGAHPYVPGRPLHAFTNERSANDEAASMVRIMQRDTEHPETATTSTWEDCLCELQGEGHDCDVWVLEIEPRD